MHADTSNKIVKRSLKSKGNGQQVYIQLHVLAYEYWLVFTVFPKTLFSDTSVLIGNIPPEVDQSPHLKVTDLYTIVAHLMTPSIRHCMFYKCNRITCTGHSTKPAGVSMPYKEILYWTLLLLLLQILLVLPEFLFNIHYIQVPAKISVSFLKLKLIYWYLLYIYKFNWNEKCLSVYTL